MLTRVFIVYGRGHLSGILHISELWPSWPKYAFALDYYASLSDLLYMHRTYMI